jgi:predicted ABC-type transport system involved in lysophospholipase L1 biosynthesis ATPase subunit
LNGEGRTIVLITHEAEVAAGASRTVRLRDGLVVSDEPSVKAEPLAAPVAAR